MENNIYLYNQLAITNKNEKENMLEIEGYCCHFNKINLNNEMVDERSFDCFFNLYNQNKLKPCLNYNHTDTTIGGIDLIENVGDGLFMKAHVNKDVAICRDMLIPNILSNDINSLSTEGFILGGYDGIVELDGGGYYCKDFMLMGVAIVNCPADFEATFSVANYMKNFEKVQKSTNSKWYLF